MRLAVVTASVDPARAAEWMDSWVRNAARAWDLYVVTQGEGTRDWHVVASGDPHHAWIFLDLPEIVGVVPAFARGVEKALQDGAEVIACLHDDLEIEEPWWDETILSWFENHPETGLLGFGGGTGLGDALIYKTPYNPMQLARQDFVSNMRHAEAHGRRGTAPERVACLDGFSQIGRREFWRGENEYATRNHYPAGLCLGYPERGQSYNLFSVMRDAGVVHHCYDAALGCFAARLGWETWMLPIPCHHHGGLTAVADPRYHQWANQFHYREGEDALQGDQAFWRRAHRIVYDQFRDVLPIRT